jgi:hypothetical protein
MPQPDDYRQTLHLDDCPEHDLETCVACITLREIVDECVGEE